MKKENWTPTLIFIAIVQALIIVFYSVLVRDLTLSSEQSQTKFEELKKDKDWYQKQYEDYLLQENDLVEAGATEKQAKEIIKASQMLDVDIGGK